MLEARQVETDPDRFIRLRDGTIYGYTSMLAKRRDASIVDGYVAAQWFKSQGIENDVTRRFETTAALDPLPTPKHRPLPAAKPNRNAVKEQMKLAREAKMAVRHEKLRLMKEAGKPAPAETPNPEPERDLFEENAVRDLLDDANRR